MTRMLAALALALLFTAPILSRAADAGTPGQNTHRIAGIGVVLANDEPGSHRIHHYIVVRGLQDKSPAMNAGVMTGDEIIAIDNFRVAGHDLKDVVNTHLRGEQDSVVQITVKRPGQDHPLTFSMVRKIIPVPPEAKPGRPALS